MLNIKARVAEGYSYNLHVIKTLVAETIQTTQNVCKEGLSSSIGKKKQVTTNLRQTKKNIT